MFNLYDRNETCVGSFISLKEAKVSMIYAYCQKEIPRLARLLETNDYIEMVKKDKETAFNDGYIEDFMTIKEED